MKLKSIITGEQLHIRQILLENLLLELQSIQDQYPDRLMITTKQLSKINSQEVYVMLKMNLQFFSHHKGGG